MPSTSTLVPRIAIQKRSTRYRYLVVFKCTDDSSARDTTYMPYCYSLDLAQEPMGRKLVYQYTTSTHKRDA